MRNIERVLDFIDETIALFEMEDFAQAHEISAEYYFTRGGCGEFYKILKSEFPQAQMYLTPNLGHVLTEIDDVLYDVRGIYSLDLDEYVFATSEMEKVFSNFAFTLAMDGRRGRLGPTNAIFLSIIDELTDDERFDFFADCDCCCFFEEEYDVFVNSKSNDCDRYLATLAMELMGVPVLSF